MKHAIPFAHVTGYRPWILVWCKDWIEWLAYDWVRDVHTYWHRARYGWAPRDTWSLDSYLDGVLAGALAHLADHKYGTPNGYPYLIPHVKDGEVLRPSVDADDPNDVVTDHDQWKADLHRWAAAFDANYRAGATDELPNVFGKNYQAWNEEEERRRKARNDALQEMLPWWDALWD